MSVTGDPRRAAIEAAIWSRAGDDSDLELEAQSSLDALLARVHTLEVLLAREMWVNSDADFADDFAFERKEWDDDALLSETYEKWLTRARAVVLEGREHDKQQEQDLGGLQSRPCESSGGAS